MSEHTPGPWESDTTHPGSFNEGSAVLAGESLRIMVADMIDGDLEEMAANANLTAAAPEMLAELKRLRDHCADLLQLIDGGVDLDLDLKRTDALIAKAKGETDA